MKTLTCKELGGACDEKFSAERFEDIAKMSRDHAMKMMDAKDEPHLAAMEAMRELMKDQGAMDKFMQEKMGLFESKPED